jgi:hypothetical protein
LLSTAGLEPKTPAASPTCSPCYARATRSADAGSRVNRPIHAIPAVRTAGVRPARCGPDPERPVPDPERPVRARNCGRALSGRGRRLGALAALARALAERGRAARRAKCAVGVDAERDEGRRHESVDDHSARAPSERAGGQGLLAWLCDRWGPLVGCRGAHSCHSIPGVCGSPGIYLGTPHECAEPGARPSGSTSRGAARAAGMSAARAGGRSRGRPASRRP